MATVVNLNKFRKGKKRDEDRQRAAENLALHGRSKKQRGAETAERRRAEHEVDGKKLD
ncbi:MAG: DUF4169 family protein [Stellaceae bacterium]